MDTEYTTKEAVENWLLKDIDDAFDTQLTEWIVAMSRFADDLTKRDLMRDEEETYKYDGDGTSLLLIKDCHDITSVTVDGTTVTPLEYPANKPYTSRIVLQNGLKFTKGNQNVLVTAKHGVYDSLDDLPANIKHAVTVLVGGICNTQILGIKKGATEKIGEYSITYATEEQRADYKNALSALSSYRRIAL